MKKHIRGLIEVIILVIYVAAVYLISIKTPLLSKISYDGKMYIEYSINSLIYFASAAGIYAFAHDAVKLIIKARKEQQTDEF